MKILLLYFLILNAAATTGAEPYITILNKGFDNENHILNVDVSWHNIKYASKSSYIGVYACDDVECKTPEIFQKNAIQYKEVNKGRAKKSSLRIFSDEPFYYPSHGTISFAIIVRLDVPAYQLAYVSGSRQYPEVNAISQPVVIPLDILVKPREVRISLGPEENSMRVMWTESSINIENYQTRILLRESNAKYTTWTYEKAEYVFQKDQLCEGNLYPAQTVGFSPLGKQVEVVFKHLRPNTTYYYVIEYEVNDKKQRIAERSFVNSNYFFKDSVNVAETNIIGFGDMGQSMNFIDGSLQHSFDNANHGETASSFTALLLEKITKNESFDVINHFGDISYATGQLALWNSFFYNNREVFSSIPWMTGIGNHELGWSQSFISGGDSQGECGVPYMFFFPFSSIQKTKAVLKNEWSISTAISKPYYSFPLKTVYNIMISTETDFSPSSPQYNWLRKELIKASKLKQTKSSSIEWILLMGHRPMYISDKFPEKTSRNLLSQLESMLVKFGVDIALWGHHHSYQRFKCKVFQEACHQNGVVQILTGHAGFNHSPISKPKYKNLFAYQDNTNWGISTLSFKNATHCEVRYIENQEAKILDRFWITKTSTWLS